MREKFLYIVLFILLVSNQLKGQPHPVSSLYMYDPMLINPAYSGVPVQFSATFIHRDQWVNLPGSPKTSSLSMQSSFFKTRVGVGLAITNDKIGIHDDFGLYATYAYHLPLTKTTKLSMGLQAGFNHLTSDFTKLNIRDFSDPNLQSRITKMNPNFGAGLYYYGEQLFVGFSVPFLLENKIVDVEGVLSEAKQSRNYYMNAGYIFIPNPNFKITPSILIRMQEGAPLGVDINTTASYKEIVGIGVSYRSNDAVIFLFQLKLFNNLHLGYAYDFTTSDLNQFSKGSHEILLNYRFKIPGIHKGLLCPAYF
jgi:type IX secretion system PorP/SprF family membrane protein